MLLFFIWHCFLMIFVSICFFFNHIDVLLTVKLKALNWYTRSSVTDLHHLMPDPAFHLDPDPDPTFHTDAVPDPAFPFDADPDLSIFPPDLDPPMLSLGLPPFHWEEVVVIFVEIFSPYVRKQKNVVFPKQDLFLKLCAPRGSDVWQCWSPPSLSPGHI